MQRFVSFRQVNAKVATLLVLLNTVAMDQTHPTAQHTQEAQSTLWHPKKSLFVALLAWHFAPLLLTTRSTWIHFRPVWALTAHLDALQATRSTWIQFLHVWARMAQLNPLVANWQHAAAALLGTQGSLFCLHHSRPQWFICMHYCQHAALRSSLAHETTHSFYRIMNTHWVAAAMSAISVPRSKCSATKPVFKCCKAAFKLAFSFCDAHDILHHI